MIADMPLTSLEVMASALASDKQIVVDKGMSVSDTRAAIVREWAEASRALDTYASQATDGSASDSCSNTCSGVANGTA
jgi:hypothetical protein